ncbi:hypothetical protein D9615_007374 [Tricholomella constricta]|uniref:histidine kinase n=1 Tax=Tricholomella constricta TaxID=117010 RepID=A0A8H5GYC8_9AGAR|nr:hypothetical protein D9615_007374 [Tricholomella constricta]
MPFWLCKDRDIGHRSTPQWTEEVDMPSLKRLGEKTSGSSNAHMLSSATSAALDDNLPLPVLASRRKRKSARVGGLAVHWAQFKRRVGTGTAPSSSSLVGDSAGESNNTRRMEGPIQSDDDEVNEVVVDRVWSEDIKSSITHSDHGGSPEKSGGSHPIGPSTSDHESLGPEGFWNTFSPIVFLRWRLCPAIAAIFSSTFADEKSEAHYAQENWFIKKSLALWASLWLILNWVLACIFARPLFQIFDKIFYYAIAPAFSIPIMYVYYSCVTHKAILFSIFHVRTFLISFIRCPSKYNPSYLCGYYPNSPHVHFECQGRDFLATFYYTTALQAIGLFGLKLNRLAAAIGAGTFFVMKLGSEACSTSSYSTAASTLPSSRFLRTNLILVLIYVHYMRESSERRLYTLRDQLKVQYKATQKAQVNERKAADSKRRLTSYVRVPLNTALLAVQNMEASGTVVKEQEIEFSALEGSLSMMSKVLNDVLDFSLTVPIVSNRMDSGQFESAFRPYGFHQVMRSLLVPLRLTTNARGLELVTELDPKIDQVARRAAYEAMGESEKAIDRHMSDHPDVEGIVIGDESRLRQIITNLASNACKFTPAGGKVSISTKLIMPASVIVETPTTRRSLNGDHDLDGHPPLSATYLREHNNEGKQPAALEWIVVRIEVTDTGHGIKPRDIVQNKLFSAFNQTEQGRQQGGKGTGLGLALVRQIVKLSGGRLGVRSRVGEGSTFWVELPLGVGRKTLVHSHPNDNPHTESERSSHATTDFEGLHISTRTQYSRPVSMRNVMTMADDAAALRASQMPVESARSSSAMQGLMEQGGRVELVLQRHGSRSPVLTRADVSTSEKALDTDTESTNGTAQRPLVEVLHSQASSSTDTAKPQVQRPTYVPLPSPRSFSVDTLPTTNSNTSNRSDKSSSSSPLAQFDSAYARGSPSSSTPAINIEPGLPVLVVDDDPLTRTLMKRILTRLGCQVSTAENGEVALEMILGPLGLHALTPSSDASGNLGPILEQEMEEKEYTAEGKFAVVFLDNQMPVLSGLKAVEKLRELGRKDLIVGVTAVWTGNALLTDQQEYLEAGVDRVLTKPVLERSLRDILVLADERRKSSPTDSPS